MNSWSDVDVAELRAAYGAATVSAALDLSGLAQRFGRLKSNVSRKARALGLTDLRRPKTGQNSRAPKHATDEARRAAIGASMKLRIRENGHPRGMKGKKHTPETLARISESSKKSWADPESGMNTKEQAQRRSDAMVQRQLSGVLRSGYTRTRGGKRADLDDRYFRSAWEANYARYLNWLKVRGEITGWEYECKTFVFEAIKRGTRSYTPDFKVTDLDGAHAWHEVKGWMDQTSVTRLARMAKYYPNERVIVIGADWFKAANRGVLPGLIPNWEGGTTR